MVRLKPIDAFIAPNDTQTHTFPLIHKINMNTQLRRTPLQDVKRKTGRKDRIRSFWKYFLEFAITPLNELHIIFFKP